MARGGQAVNGNRPVKARAFVAAATRINLRDRKEAKRQGAKPQGWQPDAWDAFDEVPEIKESVWRLGNQMAKLRIFPATVEDGEVIPADDEASPVPPEVAAAAEAELARLKSQRGGQADILRKLEQNFIVVGECYIVGFAATTVTRTNPTTGLQETVPVPEDWQVRSIDEVQNKDGVYTIRDPDQGEGQGRLLTEEDDIIRVWLEHPRYQVYADSLLRPLVTDARTVTSLTQQMYAESLSKHSAGAFLLPNELSFGPEDETEDEGGENASRDVFLEEFEASLLDPIDDPMSAAVVQPMLIRGPAELLDKVRWIPFGRETDAAIDDRINGRVERIARGLPEPVEKVMGHQETTFANAAQVDEDEFEDYLAPQADILMDALTYAYLRPQLADNPATQEWADRLVIGYDPSALIAQPDPTLSANFGLEKGLVSGETWRRVNGYSEDDAPDPLELLISAGLRRGILTADLTKVLLELLGTPLEVVESSEAPPPEGEEAPPEETPPGGVAPAALRRVIELMAAASPLELPGVAPPSPQNGTSPGPRGPASTRPATDAGKRLAAIDRDLLARLTVAANDAMNRALERVGNVLRTKASANRDLLRQVPRVEAARTLGPTLTAQALGDADPWAGAWDDLEKQFMTWGAHAQREALEVAAEVASGIDASSRELLQLRQADDLAAGWSWMKQRMDTLGNERLFAPNPLDPGIGEFDPNSKVPTGMLREAISRAGGAQGMAPSHDPEFPGGSRSGDAWVALRNVDGTPSGGIGTGETLREGMLDGGAGIEGYRWVYGPAPRARPFQPHVDLDGLEFVNFDDEALAVTGDFPDTGFYFPGDHSGCICDFEPIILSSDELGTGEPPDLGGGVEEFTPSGLVDPDAGELSVQDMLNPAHVVRNLASFTDEELSGLSELVDDVGDEGVDPALFSLWEKRGYNATPQALAPGGVEELAAQGWTPAYRGLRAEGLVGADEADALVTGWMDAYRTGDHFPGLGVYGNGSYFGDLRIATDYAHGSDPQYILKAAISPKARVVQYDDLKNALREWEDATWERNKVITDVDQFNAASERFALEQKLLYDPGRAATVMGFDAIETSSGTFVVLNRGKMAVEAAT